MHINQFTKPDHGTWPYRELSDAEMANLLDGLVGAGQWRRVPEFNCWLAVLASGRIGVFGRSGRYVEVDLLTAKAVEL